MNLIDAVVGGTLVFEDSQVAAAVTDVTRIADGWWRITAEIHNFDVPGVYELGGASAFYDDAGEYLFRNVDDEYTYAIPQGASVRIAVDVYPTES